MPVSGSTVLIEQNNKDNMDVRQQDMNETGACNATHAISFEN